MEEWRDVIGFEGLYEVSSHGRIKSMASSKGRTAGSIKRLGFAGAGYPATKLYKDRRFYARTVHSLVAEAFIGPRPEHATVNHRDGDKLNNRADNLEYCSRRENTGHAWRTGLLPPPPPTGRGASNPNASISEATAKEIIRRLAAGENPTALSRRLSVSRNVVYDIKRRRKWAHLFEAADRPPLE